MIQNDKALTTLDDIKSLGKIFVESGFFADTKDASQAVVKILVGRELGLGPMASMIGVYIVKGRPALAANVMAAKVKASGKYDYRVLKQDNQSCEIEYFEINDGKRDSLGRSTFTIEDARRAGTQNLEKYPRNMLFARAMSNGVKWFCPDITQGLTIYEPTELGAEAEGGAFSASVDEDGKVVNSTTAQPNPHWVVQKIETHPENILGNVAAPSLEPEQPQVETNIPPAPRIQSHDKQEPRAQLAATIAKWQEMITRPQSEEQIKKARQMTVLRLSACARDGSDTTRHAIVLDLLHNDHVITGSVTELLPHELYGLRDWLMGDDAKAEVVRIAATLKQPA